jgi:hypothetical protein
MEKQQKYLQISQPDLPIKVTADFPQQLLCDKKLHNYLNAWYLQRYNNPSIIWLLARLR